MIVMKDVDGIVHVMNITCARLADLIFLLMQTYQAQLWKQLVLPAMPMASM
jgi:hypothetical protein